MHFKLLTSSFLLTYAAYLFHICSGENGVAYGELPIPFKVVILKFESITFGVSFSRNNHQD